MNRLSSAFAESRLVGSIAAVMLAAAASGTHAAPLETLTIAVNTGFTTMDPWDATDNLSRTAARSFYESLYTFDKNLKPTPQLAESVDISPDGRIYTFKLRQGVKFHDGTILDAEAVKLSFELGASQDLKRTRRNFFNFVEKIEAADQYTVRFTLKSPMTAFLERLSNGTAAIACPSLLARAKTKQALAFEACGTGPYKLVRFNPAEELLVERNPDYRVPGLPKFKALRWVPVVENSTRAAMLQTGEAQFIQMAPVEQIPVLKANPNLAVNVVPSVVMRYMSMNMNEKPFDNPKVRQAVNYAINKQALCKVAFSGYARPADGVIPEQIPNAVKLGPWPYDPKKARELLKEAGYPNGFKTTLWSAFNNTTAVKTMQFVQQQLAQVGIKAEARALEAGQRVQVYGNKDPKKAPNRLYIIGWSNSTVDPDWGMRPALYSKNQPLVLNNEAYYQNPKVDALLDQALADTDPAKRAAEYKELQEMVWQDAPWAFLVFEDVTSAANKHLKNFNTLADGSFEFYSAEWQED